MGQLDICIKFNIKRRTYIYFLYYLNLSDPCEPKFGLSFRKNLKQVNTSQYGRNLLIFTYIFQDLFLLKLKKKSLFFFLSLSSLLPLE